MRSGRRLVQGGRPKDRSRSGGTAAATPGSELGNGREQKASKRKKKITRSKGYSYRRARSAAAVGGRSGGVPSAETRCRPRRPPGVSTGRRPPARGRARTEDAAASWTGADSCACGVVVVVLWSGRDEVGSGLGPCQIGRTVPELVLPARSCWAATALEELRPTGRRVRSYYACRRVCGVGRVALQVWYTGVRDKCPRGVIAPFLFKKFV